MFASVMRDACTHMYRTNFIKYPYPPTFTSP
jgi:hypothetical protein